MTGAGAWRTSWRRAAVRAAVAGMPNWRSAVHSVSAWRGWPARRPGNSHRLAGLVAVSVFCRLAAGGRVADPQEQLPVLADDVVDGQAHDAGDWLGEQEQAGQQQDATHRRSSCGRQLNPVLCDCELAKPHQKNQQESQFPEQSVSRFHAPS